MEIRKLTRTDEDFYAVLGPVFGSRLIEKQTRDRFYDDAGKVWYVITGKGGHLCSEIQSRISGQLMLLLQRY